MNDKDNVWFHITWVTVMAMFFLGMYLGLELPHRQHLADCTKQHNVYACEIQYVPVKETQKNE